MLTSSFQNTLPLAEADRQTIVASYHAAMANPPAELAHLSQDDFCSDYGEVVASWRIGPFLRADELTFRKSIPMDDPTGIGWESTILGNPTLIPEGDALHMFYRAYPRKESVSTRIGHAVYRRHQGWSDLSGPPVLYPTEADELWSVEDGKIYRHDGRYFLFYNSVWMPDPAVGEAIRRGARDWGMFVVTKLAVSDDLHNFEKRGQVVPYDVSRGWSKGAVIPRDPQGNAVRIGGRFMMFLSEGCGNRQFIGYSDDLLQWDFQQQTYLKLPPEMGVVAEVACCAARFEPTGRYFVLDIFYKNREAVYCAAQALYSVDDPTTPLEIATGGSLAWGGLVHYDSCWLVGQGWDGSAGQQEMLFYKFRGEPSVAC